jgi:allantoicase
MSNPTNVSTFTGLVDLLSENLGGKALACTDDFFAGMENLVKPGRGIFLPDEYTEQGKWMDGWESRRRRGGPDHDWCILELGVPGKIRAFDIDTNFFLGNHPPFAAVDAVHAPGATTESLMSAKWVEVLPQSPLKAGSQNLFAAAALGSYTHVRLRIYPDGGVARFRVFGDVESDWKLVEERPETLALIKPGEVDLASIRNGATALACSDMFFSPMENLITPGPAKNMGEGWETRRKRHPGHDWILIKLAARGRVDMAVLDTHFFKGNFPDSAMLQGIDAPTTQITDLMHGDEGWSTLLPETKMASDTRFHFRNELSSVGPITHIRVKTFPDGGISRMRLYGTREPA